MSAQPVRNLRPVARRGFKPVWLVALIPVCGLCLVVVLLLVAFLPRLALQAVGFVPKGDVDSFWVEQLTLEPVAIGSPVLPPPPPANPGAGGGAGVENPTPVVIAGSGAAAAGGSTYQGWFASATSPESVVIGVEGRSSVTLDTSQPATDGVVVGQATDGYGLGVVTFEEGDLAGICATLLRGCAAERFTVRRVDFRPNGAVIYALVSVEGISQEIGAALTLTSDLKGFQAAGIVLNGMLYAIPAQGEIADLVNRLVTDGNTALGDMTVQAAGYALTLARIEITDSALTLVLR